MRHRLQRVISRCGGQRGFMLVELLMASVLGIVVIGIAVALFTAANRSEPALASRNADVQEARTTMEKIVREIRQASSVSTATPSSLTMVTWVDRQTCGGAAATPAISCQVTYTCTAGTCMRTERNSNGTGSAATTTVISGLSPSSSVFCYVPSTNQDPTSCGPAAATALTYVGVTLSLTAASGQSAVVLNDGAALANLAPS